MGALLSKVLPRSMKVVMLGLDGSGKTTLLYQFVFGEVIRTIHTIGFNVERFKYKRACLEFWDIGGADKIRPLKRHYFPGCHAVILVVDSTARDRIDQVSEELETFLREKNIKHVPLLIYANKQDIPNAMDVDEIIDQLKLYKLRLYRWHIQPVSTLTREGLFEGIDWLVSQDLSSK